MKAWEGRRFSVRVEDGMEIVDTPDAVAIVAVDAQERFVLVRQARAAVGTSVLELPAGLIDEGEKPLETARRELREETGLHGGRWRELAAFWSSPGFENERVWVFAEIEQKARRGMVPRPCASASRGRSSRRNTASR